jgi:hypothetical protein
MKTVLALLLMLSLSAQADDLYVDINLHAHHWNRTDVSEQNLNEVNPGIGLHFVAGDYHKLIGVYKNSDRKLSTYALLAWTPINIGVAHVGAIGGVVTGYSSPYLPAAGLYTSFNLTDKANLNITLVPTIRSIKCYGFAGFQISFKL